MFGLGGSRSFVVAFRSECPRAADFCQANSSENRRATFSETDPFVLQQVQEQCGRHIRSMFPVEIHWSFPTRNVFFDSGLSRTIEETLVSNDSGESIERNLKIHSMQVYDERAANYESWVRAYLAKTAALGEPSPVSAFPCFPAFSEYHGRDVITAPTILSMFEEAHYSGGRDLERTIEMQQNRVNGDPASIDHTFQTTKNIYQPRTCMGLEQVDDGRLTCVWDMVNNKTGAVITAACCSTTGIGHYAHAASSLCLARDDRVGTVFVDDWPKNSKALELLLPGFNGRLDVWHVMARITDELRDGHTDYGAALRALSHVFFDWDRSDIAAVEVVLRNGSLNSHQYTREQIQATKDRGTPPLLPQQLAAVAFWQQQMLNQPVQPFNIPQHRPRSPVPREEQRPSKKGKYKPPCNCGAVDATRQARAEEGTRSGHGGRVVRHETCCSSKK